MGGFTIVVFILGVAALSPATAVEVDNFCMGCICNAVSGCDLSAKCFSGACGAFRITKVYWKDAASPTIGDESPFADGAFERCTQDFECSSQAVRNYLTDYQKDCDGDGDVDCMDLAALHVNGETNCQKPLNTLYQEKLKSCIIVNPSNTNIIPNKPPNHRPGTFGNNNWNTGNTIPSAPGRNPYGNPYKGNNVNVPGRNPPNNGNNFIRPPV